MRRFFPSLLCAVLFVASGGCFDDSAGQKPRGSEPPPAARNFAPAAFRHNLSSRLAGDPGSLWLLVTGQSRLRARAVGFRLYRRVRSAGWESVQPPARAYDGVSPVSMTMRRGAPCLAYQTRGRLRVHCRRSSGWARIPARGLPRMRLVELSSYGGRLVLSALPPRSGAVSRLAIWSFDGRRWRALGRPLPTRAPIAQFGRSAAGDLLLGVVDGGYRPVRRDVFGLKGGRWARVTPPLPQPGVGPNIGGPVGTRHGIYWAAVQAGATPWSMSVFRAPERGPWEQVTGAPLNRGPGNAQGRVDFAAGKIYASWQQHELGRRGFDARYFVAEIAPEDGRIGTVREVWRGRSIGPGDMAVTEALGKPWLLHMPQPPGSTGLRPTVMSLAR